MKTLARGRDAMQIKERLFLVTPSDTARWGTMTVAEMACHLREAYTLALGEWSASPSKTALPRPVMKWFALKMPMQWPKGIETVPELKRGAAPVPGVFERDVAGLMASLERFLEMKENRNGHAIFGRMEPGDWMRWGYLHADHHLRQFGR